MMSSARIATNLNESSTARLKSVIKYAVYGGMIGAVAPGLTLGLGNLMNAVGNFYNYSDFYNFEKLHGPEYGCKFVPTYYHRGEIEDGVLVCLDAAQEALLVKDAEKYAYEQSLIHKADFQKMTDSWNNWAPVIMLIPSAIGAVLGAYKGAEYGWNRDLNGHPPANPEVNVVVENNPRLSSPIVSRIGVFASQQKSQQASVSEALALEKSVSNTDVRRP